MKNVSNYMKCGSWVDEKLAASVRNGVKMRLEARVMQLAVVILFGSLTWN